MKKRSKKGFTLIELIVVVAILAILAAIAVPNFIGMTEKAQTSTEVAAAAEVSNAINIFNTLQPSNATWITDPATAKVTLSAAGVNLWPTYDEAAAPYVTGRITIAGGVAQVTDKANH